MGDETEKNTKRYIGTMKYLDKLGIGYITPDFDVFVTPSSFSSSTTTVEEGDPVEFTLKFNETTPQLEAINVVPLKVQSFKAKKHGFSLKTSRIRCFECGVVGHFARECKRKGKNGGGLVGSSFNSKKGSFVSVKKKSDVRKVEMVEDCFVLEFDPFNKSNHDGDDDGDDDDDDDDDDDGDGDDGESQKYGHLSKTWPSRSSISCYECGVMGHFARECKRKGKSGGRLVGSTFKKGSLVSVKKEEDVRRVEKLEDCFVLEFDPFTKSNHDDGDGDDCGAIVCVKNVEDVKKYEQVEDCFILEFDPDEPVKFSNLSLCGDDSEDVTIVGQKGKVACKDYPHPRNLCGTHPFQTTLHEVHCKMCYCYVCEEPAPCESWTTAVIGSLSHCDAADAPEWRKLKQRWKDQDN